MAKKSSPPGIYLGEISDGECKITFLSKKPFRVAEKTTIKGRLEVVAHDNETSTIVLVDESVEARKDVVRFLFE